MRSKLPIFVISLLLVAAAVAQAGPVFDDLLNYPIIDQKCPETTLKEEGMGLCSKGIAKFIELSKDQPLGQTFTLGPDADRLWRLCLGICHWPDSWQEGEEVTLSVYDTPEKKNRIYTKTLDFDRKWFKWDVAFDIDVPVKPNTQYYFELTHNGAGDNKINIAYIPSDDYPRGKPYVAGQPKDDFDLYFVAISKPKRDREQNLRMFLSRFDLDNPSLSQAKAAYAKGDLDAACNAILAAYEDLLRNADWPWRAKPGDKVSERTEKIVSESRYYNNDEGKTHLWIPMSPKETTWREVEAGTAEYVRMNDVFANLGHAYTATGDEKYAAKLNELMADYMQDNASPFEGGMRGGRWVAMFQAWRLGDAWDGIAGALDSKSLTPDVRLGWIDYWSRMAHFAITEPSGGNHANAVAEALMRFASRFPMYADSKKWFQGGFDLLVSNSLELFYDDGACVEPAMNYHGYSLSNLLGGLETAAKFGIEPPAELIEKVEKALVYTAYMMRPDGTIPPYGDTNCEDFRVNPEKWRGWRKGEPLRAWNMFGRSDCLYISTTGKQGTHPSETSYCFPEVGHYVMRSDWGGPGGENFEDARYLFLRAGRQGSHGHDDMNMITLYAYGRPLIIDPGRTTYGTPLMYELSKNRSHSVLLVDDLDRMNRVEGKIHAWHTTPVMDFVDNGYENLYPGVNHRRAVVFVRPGYYVMFDTATADTPRDFGINFWLTPPELQIDQTTAAVCSTEPAGANVLLKVLGDDVAVHERKGTIDLGGREWNDIPVVTFKQSGDSKAEFTTIMYPFPGKADMKSVQAQEISVEGGRGCIVRSPEGTDIVFYSTERAKAELPRRAAAFEGRAGLVRLQDNSFAMVDGTLMVVNGRTLATSPTPVQELSVRYLPDAVEVTCPELEPGLEIATLGRTKAIVNGKAVNISGEMYRVF